MLRLLPGLAALWLVACAPTPVPPPDQAPAASEVSADPQLAFATRLVEATLAKIARQHVAPVPADALQGQFAGLLAEQLAETPWRDPRPAGARHSVADTVRILHQRHPSRPILPAVESALAQLVARLDSDSIYFDREQFALLQSRPRDTAGIGVSTGTDDTRVVIREVFPGGPAERAGLKPGDRLLAIDGQPLADRPHDWILTRLHGAPGSRLTLQVQFAEGDEQTIHLQREQIERPLVEGRWLNRGIAYIRLRALSDTSLDEFNTTLLGLIRKQRAPRALVLDLRGNRGGVLDSAVHLADLFVAEGTLLTVRGRVTSDQIHYLARPRSQMLEQTLPLALLIDAETAAGAESIAAAMQDQRRALLVGEQTRGAGRLYTVFELPGKRGLKLASGHLYRPGGDALAGAGVLPDICMAGETARLLLRDARDPVGCRVAPGKSVPDGAGTDRALQQAARILADRALYRDLLEGRVRALPAP